MSEENMAWLAGVYLAEDALPERRAHMIEALIDSGSPSAQRAVVNMVRCAVRVLLIHACLTVHTYVCNSVESSILRV